MPLTRRDLLEFVSVSSVMASCPAAAQAISEQRAIKALAFDAFPIFDPRKITHIAVELYGDQGRNLASLWFQKIFNYMFILSAAEKYLTYEAIAQNALRETSRFLKIMPIRSDEERMIGAFYELPVWPDIVPALQTLQSSHIKNMFLSNMPSDMLKKTFKIII